MPLPVLEVPAHGLLEARLEGFPRPPAKLAANLVDVHRIAPVVAGAVLHELDKVRITAGRPRPRLFQQRAQGAHEIDVRALGLTTDVVGLAEAPLLEHQAN